MIYNAPRPHNVERIPTNIYPLLLTLLANPRSLERAFLRVQGNYKLLKIPPFSHHHDARFYIPLLLIRADCPYLSGAIAL